MYIASMLEFWKLFGIEIFPIWCVSDMLICELTFYIKKNAILNLI